jgi:hypothetical protein
MKALAGSMDFMSFNIAEVLQEKFVENYIRA